MAPDRNAGSILLDGKPPGTGSSRLAALLHLRAAHGDLKARLRRPPLRLTHRYRDLILFTRLIQLELDHVAGRTTWSRNSAAGAAQHDEVSAGEGAPDPAWSDPWGLTCRQDLETVLLRYSAKRERVGRLLALDTRARAAAAAERRYEAVALTIPWQMEAPPTTLPSAGPTRGERLVTAAGALGARLRAGGRELGLAAAVGVVALALMLDVSDPRSGDRAARPALNAGAGSVLQAAVPPPFGRLHTAPVESPSRAEDAPAKRDQPTRAARDSEANEGASQVEDGGDPVSAPVPASAPGPVATVPTSAEPPPAPPPAPPPQPAAESPPEFGF